MGIGAMVLGAAVVAIVSGIVNMIFWVAFQRRVEQRDAEFAQLKNKVDTLEGEKMKALVSRMDADHSAHSALHEKINRLPDVFVTRRECGQLHDAANHSFELVRQELARTNGRLDEVVTTVDESAALTRLIAGKMNIDFDRKFS